ncbi:MAG: cation-translocating P-type ATPase [Chloroflexi bacterium]|nr:cation-translocating P-type ATPase [Chloroflexota bacterium]
MTLEPNLTHGFSAAEAAERLQKFGPNVLRKEQGRPAWRQFLDQFTDFIVLLLIAAAVVSSLLGEQVDAAAILVIVIVNALLGFIQEYRAEQAIHALRQMTAPSARVLRDGVVQTIPSREVVPGDLLLLKAGDLVAADARLLETHSLRVDESAFTGESAPIKKNAHVRVPDGALLGERYDMVFSSTMVTYGKGRAVVSATGMDTELGKISGLVQSIERESTPLQQRLEQVGRWLVYATLGIVAIVFVAGWLRGNSPLEMFLVAVTLAVAAVPEGLAAVVTIALALGVRRMVRRHALIRRLPSVETLGAATVICTDKTGTLTQNAMTVRKLVVGSETFEVTGSGHTPQGGYERNGTALLDLPPGARQALTVAALCNNAQIRPPSNGQTTEDWEITGSPTEAALMVAAAKGNVWRNELEQSRRFVAELPFDSERKRMSVVWAGPNDGVRAYVKGAPDVVLGLCTAAINAAGEVFPLSPERREVIRLQNDGLSKQAMRVLAVAYRDVPPALQSGLADRGPDELETGLTFAGLFAMSDPLRPEALPSVQACQTAGIRVVMITGDHRETAVAIAHELDILGPGQRVITGRELDELSDAALQEAVEEIRVYARVSPAHKLRIVRAWKAQGHVVAMTGDGVNDAPALKEAQIGVAMGLSGTDVAKEAADMVLTDDNFASIVAAVEEGRVIFDNIRRFIHYLLSCNIGEVLTMFVATLIGMPLPLVPIQILWINLATDSLPALALGVEEAEPGIMQRAPRPADEEVITHPMPLLMGLQGVVIATVTLLAFTISIYLWGESVREARVMAFSTSVVAQNVHAFNLRSNRISLFRLGLFSNMALVASFVVMVISELIIIYVPFFQPFFQTLPVTLADWGIILTLGFMPLLLMEGAKFIWWRLRP